MVLFRWGSEFSVGVAEIDAQHKRMVDLINELHDAMLAGQSDIILERVFEETVFYARYHLGWEEDLMAAHGYPDLVIQQREHALFTARVNDLQARFEAGEAQLSLDVVLFLVDWLAGHIQGLDAKLGRFLNEKGIR